MKKGISLVALVITIIVLIILVGVVIITGINSPKSAQLAVFYNNVTAMQEAVTMKIMNNTINYTGQGDTELYKWVGVISGYTVQQASNKTPPEFNDKTIKGVSVEKLDSSLKTSMSISDNEFNKYYVDNKGIVYHEGFTYEGNTYYNKTESTVSEGGGTGEGGIVSPSDISTVTLTPNGNSTSSAIQSTTIQITNASSVEYKYGWSTSDIVAPKIWTESTSKSQIVSQESGSGNYYLWIKEVKDSTGKQLLPITNEGGTVYVVSGAFVMEDANIPFKVTSKSASEITVEVVKDMLPGQTPTYYYSKDDGVTWTAGMSVASYTFKELSPASQYKIKVKATAGSTSQTSNSVVGTTKGIEKGTSTPANWNTNSLNSSTKYIAEEINGIKYYAPIPKGFTVSEAITENTISGGLVIYEGDIGVTNENVAVSKTTRNQFVWVPVNASYNMTSMANETALAYWENRVTGVGAEGSGYNEPYPRTAGSWTKTEWDAMHASVMKYGGFYIGRYEAGNAGGTAVVKQGQTAWTNIPWGPDMTTEPTGTYAVSLSRNMYRNNSIYGVTSTLIYGIQWDSVANWANCTNEARAHGLDITGAVENDKYNNVYDLRSNLKEFSMEASAISTRTIRGGSSSSSDVVSWRGILSTVGSVHGLVGFRPVLYVNI